MRLQYLLVFLLLISAASATNSSSTSFNLNGVLVDGAVNGSTTSFNEVGVLGQVIVGNGSSASFNLQHGILVPAAVIVSGGVAGGSSSGNGGCAQGFTMIDNGTCILNSFVQGNVTEEVPLTTIGVSLQKAKNWMQDLNPSKPLLAGIIILGSLYILLVVLGLLRDPEKK